MASFLPSSDRNSSLSSIRVALVLPPTQSFYMPYCAPSSLAAWLQKRFGTKTLVVDAGIEWLHSELDTDEPGYEGLKGALTTLKDPETYRNIWTLQRAYQQADEALKVLCSPWMPECVSLSGKYTPPDPYTSWDDVVEVVESRSPRLFDRYIDQKLIPKLQRFQPDIVGLSIPFDWMIFPGMRLAHRLQYALPKVVTVLGGHAVKRLWHEKQFGFFKSVRSHWAAVGAGEAALGHLMAHLFGYSPPPAVGPLLSLPLKECDIPAEYVEGTPGYLEQGLIPDFSDLELTSYLRCHPLLPVPASKGCSYGLCRFCRQQKVYAEKFCERDPLDVAMQMQMLSEHTGAKEFIPTGDNVSHTFLLDLARALQSKQAHLNWFCEASLKSVFARRLSASDCRLLREGGCRIMLNGLESGSPKIREQMGCPVSIEQYEETILDLVENGIIPYITLIIGYPGETLEDLQQTIDFVKRHLHHAVFSFSRFSLFNGIPLAKELYTRPGSVCRRRSVLEGAMEYEDSATLSKSDANNLLTRELAGMFSPFATFLREIPILMQLVEDVEQRNPEAILNPLKNPASRFPDREDPISN